LPIARPRRLIVAIILTAIVLVAITVVYIWIHRPDPGPIEVERADYLDHGPHNKPVAVVFVHGIFGTKTDTWINRDASFPALLAADPEFRDQIDVFLYEYFTPKFGNANSIVGLADQLRGSLEYHRVFEDHRHVVFLSHSMGGLVVRQFLLTKRDRMAKVPMLYFYATPTFGTELTVVAKEISSNPQLRGMIPIDGNDLLQSIQSQWLGSEEAKKIPSYCAYETIPIYGTTVVSQGSATALCNQDLDPISSDHIDIVKPRDRGDGRYTTFASAMRSSVLPPPAPTPDQRKDASSPGQDSSPPTSFNSTFTFTQKPFHINFVNIQVCLWVFFVGIGTFNCRRWRHS
jgi:pimeloyl-ACP methyl ester carboxylesterase